MCASDGSEPAGLKEVSWPPSRRSEPLEACPTALLAQLGASELPFRAPGRLSNRPPSATWPPHWPLSATWRFLDRFLVLLQPSESSSRLDESSILTVQAFLQFKRSWTAVLQLCNGSRTPFGLNLEAVGSLLGRSWSLFGQSWALLARCWKRLGRILGALGSILGANWKAKTVQNRAQEMIRVENGETLIFDDSSMDFNDFCSPASTFWTPKST